MKRKLPREEKEEKKNKKAKRMKTKEEQRAEKSKKQQRKNNQKEAQKGSKKEQQENNQKEKQEESKKEQQENNQKEAQEGNKKEQQENNQKEAQEESKKEQQENNQKEAQKQKQEEQENKQQGERKKETKKQQEEQEKKKKETKDLMLKETPLNELQLEKIEREIKTQAVITEEKKNKIHKKIFQNIAIAIGIVLYFIFINLGFANIKPETFYKDLQVFSIISIIFTIVLMEKAYQKDNNEFTLFAIESLVFSICTLCTIYIRNYYSTQFVCSINVIAILFAIYYVGKCIVIDYKMTKKAKKQAMHKHKLTKD